MKARIWDKNKTWKHAEESQIRNTAKGNFLMIISVDNEKIVYGFDELNREELLPKVLFRLRQGAQFFNFVDCKRNVEVSVNFKLLGWGDFWTFQAPLGCEENMIRLQQKTAGMILLELKTFLEKSR